MRKREYIKPYMNTADTTAGCVVADSIILPEEEFEEREESGN